MFIRNTWYYAAPARELKAGGMLSKVLLGEPVVFARDADGTPFAMRDLCPHRGVPLSFGRVCPKGEVMDGAALPTAQIECPYHGWRFGPDGRCAAIPSLVEGQEMDVGKIRVRRYPVREIQGALWVWMSGEPVDRPVLDDGAQPDHEPPVMPEVGDRAPALIERQIFDCHADHAVIGLMDPAHGPYVHKSVFWRSAKSMHAKKKEFGPSEMGFTMLPHPPSKNSKFYRVLGGDLTTAIAFRLPGIRTEHITVGGRGHVVGLTAVTPVDETTTEVTQSFYWTLPWLGALKPVLKPFARRFLGQDRDMVNLQKEGLKHDPRLMLINDADVQAKWYFRLKKAWEDAGQSRAAFDNPVKPATLRWRS
jgi:phenylpropionate dioxygenase-like ring-hydroxylating dioxygenase large terminal subunit